jgi:hypothetical protein
MDGNDRKERESREAGILPLNYSRPVQRQVYQKRTAITITRIVQRVVSLKRESDSNAGGSPKGGFDSNAE